MIPADQAKIIRRTMGDRIITSRMVRRWKPGETLEAKDTAKSRWCVHGHKDPDALGLEVFAPTPQGLAFMVYVQMLSSLGMLVDVADVKGAFTQGDPLRRAGGPYTFWLKTRVILPKDAGCNCFR